MIFDVKIGAVPQTHSVQIVHTAIINNDRANIIMKIKMMIISFFLLFFYFSRVFRMVPNIGQFFVVAVFVTCTNS